MRAMIRSRRTKYALVAVLLAVVCQPALAQEYTLENEFQAGWGEEYLLAFSEGCWTEISVEAKRSYADAAKRAGNDRPVPFPEEALRESIQPMCDCIGRRLVESVPVADLERQEEFLSNRFVEQALTGGRCRPGGLLGRILGLDTEEATQ